MKTWEELSRIDDKERADRLAAAAPEMLGALRGLLEWAAQMGGWEAPCWRRAEMVVESLDYEDETEDEHE